MRRRERPDFGNVGIAVFSAACWALWFAPQMSVPLEQAAQTILAGPARYIVNAGQLLAFWSVRGIVWELTRALVAFNKVQRK